MNLRSDKENSNQYVGSHLMPRDSKTGYGQGSQSYKSYKQDNALGQQGTDAGMANRPYRKSQVD